MTDTSFESLGLSEPILKALVDDGYETPTPIQSASIPSLLEGHDLLGCAQTGTGKTAAFALPIIQKLATQPAKLRAGEVRALIVSPTRELAAQIDENFGQYSKYLRLSRACIFGGVGKMPQERALSHGVDILTATPGRLLDLHNAGKINLDRVEIFVLDEADRMLDMGFIHDVRKIIGLIPKERQTLLFSATMPDSIAGLASKILKKPIRVDISPEKPTVELIDQSVIYAEKDEKRWLLTAFLEGQNVQRALVFTKTKHGADRLVKQLERNGISSAAIHANKSQNNRIRTLEGFRSGEIRVLVATDLAARGIDVDDITHVFNYELPNEPETYVHRIGRTARAGASGIAVAFCASDEKPLLRSIERLIGKKVPLAVGPEIDAVRKLAAELKAAEPPAPPHVERAERADRDRRGPHGRREERAGHSGSQQHRGYAARSEQGADQHRGYAARSDHSADQHRGYAARRRPENSGRNGSRQSSDSGRKTGASSQGFEHAAHTISEVSGRMDIGSRSYHGRDGSRSAPAARGENRRERPGMGRSFPQR